ncbi:MAG: hypothetical protein A2138_22020 [Deltaproteobacteria bacterium RBG_16_71_12]|nr:MAG: hypothetical protein A2138_22020 [Deltaproteobacteria bacterium RBG_16_71_12]
MTPLVLLCVLPVVHAAVGGGGAVADSPTTAAPHAEGSAPAKLLVLEPVGDSTPADIRRLIASTLTVELAANRGITVLSATDVKRLAELEADKQSVGCEDAGCLAEIAGALGARFVVFGDATQLGAVLVVNLNLFDVTKASAVERVAVEVRDMSALPERLREAARQLGRAASGDAKVNARSSAPRVDASSSPQPLARSSPSVLPWVVGGVGATVAAGGLVFDAVSPTSNNAIIDAVDFVGPVALLAGLALGGTAAALALTDGP